MLAKKRLIEATRPLSVVRGIVDPTGSLPDVHLSRNDEHNPYAKLGLDSELTYGFWIQSRGKTVGDLALAERPGAGELHMAGIDAYRQGVGYGLASYLLAIELAEEAGTVLVPDRKLSCDAVSVWQKLVDHGVAQQFTDFEGTDPSLPYDQQKYYTAEIVVDPAAL